MRLPLHSEARLLRHHADGLYAVYKPGGLRAHPNEPGVPDPGALLTWPYDPKRECYENVEGGPDSPDLHLINRIDAPTSGLVLLASDPALAKRVRAAFADHQVRKTYLGVVKGHLPLPKGVWRDRLETARKGGHLRVRSGRGLPSETAFIRVAVLPGPPTLTLVELHPLTGRTHQLRVQCAQRHCPLVGDATYGDFSFNREFKDAHKTDRLFLHAWKVELHLAHPKPLKFQAVCPPPPHFHKLFPLHVEKR